MAASLTVHAPAKINLSLEVLRRRDDGYHEVSTVLQTVSLADELTVTLDHQLTLQCSLPDLSGAQNLVLSAASELRRLYPTAPGARVVLQKRIPVAAGLGGGSSDAAATLRALAQLWKLPIDETGLHALAATLGSDVPFFLRGGTALATGRGGQIEPLPSAPPLWLVLLPHRQSIPDKTRQLYAALAPTDFGDGRSTRELVNALRSGISLDPSLFVNSFAVAAMRVFPGLNARVQRIEQIAGSKPHLAGSGPTLFLAYPSEIEARAAAQALAHHQIEALIAQTVSAVH